jgi:hypothetical protein
MTEVMNKEQPLCCVCEVPTDTDLHDPALGNICYPCRQEAANAENALKACDLTTLLATPKNNRQSK